MEKKIIKVVFDNDLKSISDNLDGLRLGSSRSVEMWFRFENPLENVTYRLNALLPNKENVYEQLADIVEEDGYIWHIWKIDEAYTGSKGKLMVSLSCYSDSNNEVIYVTEPIDIYCEFAVKGNSQAVFVAPNDYELLLYGMSKKADLDTNGKLLESQMPQSYSELQNKVLELEDKLRLLIGK